MAVLFIESKSEQRIINGVSKRVTKKYEKIISLALFKKDYQNLFKLLVLDSTKEARDLALYSAAWLYGSPYVYCRRKNNWAKSWS